MRMTTDDGVDVLTLVGKTAWYLDGFSSDPQKFLVEGVDIVRGDGGELEARVYGEDKTPWLEPHAVRAVAGSWLIDYYTRLVDKLQRSAAEEGIDITYTVTEKQ